MAKTIMISNDVYNKLKKIKGKDSFSEVMNSFIKKKNVRKTGEGLKECLGLLSVDDVEDKKIEKELKEGWARWTKRYA